MTLAEIAGRVNVGSCRRVATDDDLEAAARSAFSCVLCIDNGGGDRDRGIPTRVDTVTRRLALPHECRATCVMMRATAFRREEARASDYGRLH